MDVLQRDDLSFLRSLPEFQRLFPDDTACAAYLEKARWGDGFVCPHCQTAGEPFRFTSRPGVLRCRKCRRDTGLTAGTVMERTHTPLSVWFWAAYLVASQTPGMSATQFQRQVGLSRYETAFQILQAIGDETVISSIQRFNPDTGKFETAGYLNGQIVGVDFPISTGEGYFIYMKQEVMGFRP